MAQLRFSLIALLFLATACSTAARTRLNTGIQEGANITTDVVQPIQDLAVVSCDAAEGIAIERHDNADEAEAEVRSIREGCDKIFASVATVQAAQTTLRSLGDAYQAGTADYGALLGALADVRALAAEIKSLVAQFRAEHGLEDGQ